MPRIAALLAALAASLISASAFAQAQTQDKPFEPQVGQPGKDVVWVPTPQALVDKMLEMAKLTPKDFLIDLGSGDGRTVITAAKRGSVAHGIEYNPDMVELSKRNAQKEGVSSRATFAKADIFESDFSKAQVITLFLLPSLNVKLRPTLLNMKPGTRIVSNSFDMEDWKPDQTATVQGCTSWCTALLWIVPAKVDGSWKLPKGDLSLTQNYQMLNGTLRSGNTATLVSGRMNGDEISFTAGNVQYNARVSGNMIDGSSKPGGAFKATR